VKPPLAQFQATKCQKEDMLKLLKTLNAALAEHALPETHIDEAFDVWWPKLDLQLKDLPPDELAARPRRTERDLLEEILDLVRNQNRLTGIWAKEAKEFEHSMFRDIILEAARLQDESIKKMSSGHNESHIFCTAQGKTQKYEIMIPFNAAVREIGALVKSQMINPVKIDFPVPKHHTTTTLISAVKIDEVEPEPEKRIRNHKLRKPRLK
jgi:hypothetical protein